ncbi:bifunctional tRNA (5-methylaminomethyl-2-thiouridine)(34)-methyltransferase MnmD/FAD-dependent 5-carboxymethylaminomethyl-2-thiouridine(34) oxidoreductase MnmC [Betaproteobacteria bacterium SCN2]|jgi:tRNA 5-methylaminomethyl-2-thiouridine biosynthesis bifunctional protein|nr:bifunctional tRNA (5-methylaminomethyl-2-thiouridine)(34)-methyltransferase MnmD/FAD-dependent 5-carboxymethylaminomethyl-2-thiouridine(34) oxidoreductase MnmC [Betaproteobacteria bacterium SCN2]
MPITPGEIAFAENGIPASPAYGDIYHSADGGLQQARSVFLQGCKLPQAWQDVNRFVILETGFGLGLNFLATWQAFREHPGHCSRLHFISVEKHPLSKDTLARCHAAWPELSELAQQLREQWPLLVAGYHHLQFDDGRVQLTLIFDDAETALKQLEAKADAIYLDGFSPAKNPDIWSPALLAQFRHLASPGARLSTWCVAGKVRQALQAAGFEVERRPGFGHKKERLEARFAQASAHRPQPPPAKTAAIIGAGIAGSALAHALCKRGFQVILIERHPHPAMGASGNPAGVVRPQLALDDSFNGRLSRQCFLHTVRLVSASSHSSQASHAFDGVLQLARDEANAAHMQAMLAAHAYPGEFARWVTQDEASDLAGVPVAAAGIHFPHGGWMAGPRVCPASLDACGASLTRRFMHAATRLERTPDGWRVWDEGRLLAETSTVILAGAHEAIKFANLPLTPVRGQVTTLSDGSLPGLNLPVTREGYVLPTVHGIGNIGASFGFDDDPVPRESDQASNIERLSRLLQHPPTLAVSPLGARVSFRAATPDRLPFAGAIADDSIDIRAETPLAGIRRQPGLFALTGLGARGLVWGPFLAEALAARLDHEPWQLPRDLWQAIDPARFLLREARRKRA